MRTLLAGALILASVTLLPALVRLLRWRLRLQFEYYRWRA